MAKIRGFKPELWTDDDFVELSPFARLLWMGMWNFACDNGHLQDKSKQLKGRVLPMDDVNCAELLREIETQGLIRRADGWITIPKLTHHQKPHKRWFVVCEKPGCVMPEGASYGYSKRESTVEQPLSNREQPLANGGSTDDVDVEGDVDGELKVTSTSSAADAASQKKAPRRATRRPDDFRPSQAHIDLAADRGIDLPAEWPKFCDWCDANGKTYKDWPAALRTWIRNARPSRAPAEQQPHQGRASQWLQLAHDLGDPPANVRQIGPTR